MLALALALALLALGASAADDLIFVGLKVSWHDAEKHCHDALGGGGIGGHLASIHSLHEAHAVKRLCGGDNCWIGLSDGEEEGTWRWTDGTKNDFTHWLPGEPNGGKDETTDYAYLRDYDGQGRWDDSWADDKSGEDSKLRGFVCRDVSASQAHRGICGTHEDGDYVWDCRVSFANSRGGTSSDCGSTSWGLFLGVVIASLVALFCWLYPVHKRGGDVKSTLLAGCVDAADGAVGAAAAVAQRLPERIRPTSGPLARMAPRPSIGNPGSAAPLARSDHMPTPTFSPLNAPPISAHTAASATAPMMGMPQPGPESASFGAPNIMTVQATSVPAQVPVAPPDV